MFFTLNPVVLWVCSCTLENEIPVGTGTVVPDRVGPQARRWWSWCRICAPLLLFFQTTILKKFLFHPILLFSRLNHMIHNMNTTSPEFNKLYIFLLHFSTISPSAWCLQHPMPSACSGAVTWELCTLFCFS